MKPNFSIRDKLVVYYTLLIISSIIFVGVYSFSSAKKAIIERASKQLTSVREFKKKQVEIFFVDRQRDVQILVNSLENVKGGGDGGFERFQQMMDIMLNSGYYTLIVYQDSVTFGRELKIMVGETSHFVASEIERAGAELGRMMRLKKRLFVHDYILMGSTPTVFITSPVFDRKGNACGFISAGLPSSTINALIFENTAITGLGFSGESYIVGSDFLMRSSSRFITNSILKNKVRTAATLDVFNKGNGNVITRDYRNIEVVSSYAMLKIKDLRWALLAEIDMKEILVPVVAIRNKILTFISVVSIIVLFMAFFISYRITEPLTRLLRATSDVGQGKYGTILPVTSTDEIGELTKSFNTMSSQVLERTRELKMSEKRLNKFYHATKDGIVIHDGSDLLMINNAFSRMTGFSMDELMGLSLVSLLKLGDYAERMLDVDATCGFEATCVRKDGCTFPVEISKSAIEYDGIRVSSTIIHDISERVESQRLLEKERQKQFSSFIDGQENERKRLSRELHDGLGQSLIAIKMRLESIDLEDHKKQSVIDITKGLVDSAIDDVRRMSNNLMPSVLVEFGIIQAISNLVKQASSSTSIHITFDHGGVPKDLDQKVQLYVFRIVQEAINNAVKHSEASQIEVMLLRDGKSLVIIIEDDGLGFSDDHETKLKGNGLYNISERVQALNGSIDFTSIKNKGLTIRVKIPI